MLDTRDLVFDRVMVDFLVKGGARVSWRLARDFFDPAPYTFQLQVGSTGDPLADDWTNVGAPQTNVFTITDTTQREYGKNPVTHYRVILTTGLGTYTSRPCSILGVMDHHNWMIAREIVRREKIRLGRTAVRVQGWLLKRRWQGVTPDPTNLATATTDYLTGAIIRSDEATTVGTPFLYGYYAPVPFTIDKSPEGHNERYDDSDNTTDAPQNAITCRALMVPPLATLDVFVAQYSDRRYYFHQIEAAAEVQGVPVIANCTIRRAPSNDVIYSVVIPAE